MATIIRNATLINEGKIFNADVLIKGERIERIDGSFDVKFQTDEINGEGKFLIPGIIDGQVHFREPGLTHKADLASESKAAVAGGVTSFIDMPNTIPNVLSLEILEEKNRIASQKAIANYGFFLGVNADNIDYVLRTDTSHLLAVSDDGLYFTKKGNLLADSLEILEKLLAGCQSIIAIHAEKEAIIEENEIAFKAKFGDDVPVEFHPVIRSEEACYNATKDAIALAQKHGARLHILHLSTAKETALFTNKVPLAQKKITTEVSVHHLWFCDSDYARLGKKIKWNPAIKTKADKEGLLQALIDDRIDIVTTDHAPHTWAEKDKPYFQSMSGAPIVQHSLNVMLEFFHEGKISLEKIIEKMCHNPAILYSVSDRGFLREGYYADAALFNTNEIWTVQKNNLYSKCGWSPLEGQEFKGKVETTFVNGNKVFDKGVFNDSVKGKQLVVSRKKIA
jgi:dihydroorotase